VANEKNTASEKRKEKRRLRPTQTVREQREQSDNSQKNADKPRRSSKVFAAVVKPLKPLARPLRPVGRVLQRVGRFIIPKYFRNSWSELRLVTWPNFTQTRRLTGAVIIFSIIFAVIIAITDYGLDKVFKKVILDQ